MRRVLYLLPVLIFVGLTVLFLKGLTMDPREIPSVLIDRPVPEMALAPLPGRGAESGLASADLKGRVSVVNIYGSWCIACVQEHPTLMALKSRGEVPIHGIDWRDDPEQGAAWLKKHGDPYQRVGSDPAPGRAAVDFGVTGAPESFIVDRNGIIRYKHVGPITPDNWRKTLLPIIRELEK
ncbi:DsbE family thiol:disulfide interchange protein [Magnetospirillum fulvum]|uniref:Cytochrome c biogenesis protein CcmG, thiol:disulfide interchange protein DsbE n=1 Tax=Magnetospirillum fulvum TaxID=1082 RepID=A0A1H6IF88_MAGFU|nr:DsbE family thiol:disulfide interchange protein [Magnetospirillum fulvum]SEH44917.1 cytochrome c biogenesis protein CcmG, thiol:disulfide interchange protein DsbE [Magnetospirillum fulvum]